MRTDLFASPEVAVFLAMLGIGAIIAVVGGALFVGIIVATVLTGRRTATPALGRIAPDAFRPIPPVTGTSSEVHRPVDHRGFEVPGTLVISLGFLTLFIVLYGVSWIELSSIPWRIG